MSSSRNAHPEPWRPARFVVDGITKRQVQTGTRFDVRVRVDGAERRVVCHGQQQARNRRKQLEKAFADSWLWDDALKGFVEPKRAAARASGAQQSFVGAAAAYVATLDVKPKTRGNVIYVLSHAATRLMRPPLAEDDRPEVAALLRRHVLAVRPGDPDDLDDESAERLERARKASLPLADITQDAAREVLATYSRRNAVTANHCLRILSHILRGAGLEDPTGALKRREGHSAVDVDMLLTPEQVWDVGEAAEELRATAGGTWRVPAVRLAILLLGMCGLRPGEAAALRRCDLVEKGDRLWVVVRGTETSAQSYAMDDEEDTERGPAKHRDEGDAGRRIPLPRAVEAVAREHLATHTGPAATAPLTPHPSGPRRGKAVRQQTQAKWYRRALDRVVSEAERELLDARPHGLRHAAVTHWLQQGIGVPVAKRWSGHGSAKTLIDTYGGAMPDDDEYAVAKLD